MKVTVLTDALDSAGLPAYGPDVTVGKDRAAVRDALGGIPSPLRDVWLCASVTTASEAGFFTVDRRMVSVETKRALEGVPSLEFRQGLVTDLRVMGGDLPVPDHGGKPFSVAVETAFGEVVAADAVVLAVGLGIGGRVRVGADVLRGERYRGTTPGDGLGAALERLGARFEEIALEVGPRVGVRGVGDLNGWVGDCCGFAASATVVGAVPLGRVLEGVHSAGRASGIEWPAEYPRAPHWSEGLRAKSMAVVGCEDGEWAPWLSPDGAATGEFHVCPAGPGRPGAPEKRRGEYGVVGAEVIASRLPETVTGLRIVSVSGSGRLESAEGAALPMWAAGRAGGARSYLESLESGVRVAHAVVAAFCEVRREGSGFGQ